MHSLTITETFYWHHIQLPMLHLIDINAKVFTTSHSHRCSHKRSRESQKERLMIYIESLFLIKEDQPREEEEEEEVQTVV